MGSKDHVSPPSPYGSLVEYTKAPHDEKAPCSGISGIFDFFAHKHGNGRVEASLFNRGVEGIKRGQRASEGGSTFCTDLARNLDAGISVLSAYLNSSYMTWDRGSALIFWRWPPSLQTIARDGFPSRLIHTLPTHLKRPQSMKEDDRLKLLDKLRSCLSRGYLKFVPEAQVNSYIDIFGVAKGVDDIRMVLNGASCDK